MLWPMKSRIVLVGFGATALLGLSGCGSSAGTGAAPATTIRLGTPSYQTLLPQVTSTLPAQTVPGQVVGIVPGEQTHTVVSGDYLVKIAKSFCTTAQKVADYNAWTDGILHPLQPGQVIKIAGGSCAPGTGTTTVANTNAATAATTATPQQTTTTFNASAGGTYTVVAGDYLGKIATKTGSTVAGIVAANGWADSTHRIDPGQVIKLPAKTG